MMKITFLGTGTSSGVPMIGCDCPVCTSPDPRNRRTRTSLYVETGEQCLLIDTPPDFREQALACNVIRVDAVLFTHTHADHIFGLDDIRRYNTIQDSIIPAYASPTSLLDLERIFDYIKPGGEPGLYRPRIEFKEFNGAFTLGNAQITPLSVEHGPMPTHGFRIDSAGRSVGYVPDCHAMPDDAVDALCGVDVMILDALKHTPHRTHFTVAECVSALERIGAVQSYLIHMGHQLDHAETEAALPDGMRLTYDGLVLTV